VGTAGGDGGDEQCFEAEEQGDEAATCKMSKGRVRFSRFTAVNVREGAGKCDSTVSHNTVSTSDGPDLP
jgi:hypothetical protein